MNKIVVYIVFILGIGFCQAQGCPELTAPLNNEGNVSVLTAITWENLPGQSIYLISLGTTPGGSDLVDRRTSGTFATFTPPKGLPERTRIYVSLQIIGGAGGSFDCEIGSFVTEDVTTTPSCTNLRNPLNNAIFVREEVNIVWNYAPLATGYRITMGTSPGGSDLVENFDTGNFLFYDPPADLPVNAIVYVKIIPFNENGDAPMICPEESFAVRIVESNLDCTQLTYPLDGDTEIPKSLALEWAPVQGATGYKVSVSTSPSPNDIVYTAFVDDIKTETIELESSNKYFVTIIPFNDAGEAVGCTNESFTTIVDCGPFIDELTGEVVILNPLTTLPDEVFICNNHLPNILTATDSADGYRWYKIDSNGDTTLISEKEEVELTEPGSYLYEVYNTTILLERTIECASSSEFSVILDEGPIITNATAIEELGQLQITVEVQGTGAFEYGLESAEGPFQNSNVFESIPLGSYTVFVRDEDGCGVSQRMVQENVETEIFPKFFTPNGDGVNDFWQLNEKASTMNSQTGLISIFDRYGVLLVQIAADSQGWDGTINGRPLPSSEYWFQLLVDNEKEFKGHFSLKR